MYYVVSEKEIFMNNQTPLEIERKFLISKPSDKEMIKFNIISKSYIEQIYLKAENNGISERIRKRVFENKTQYTHTQKRKITNAKRVEIEKEITGEEFESLKKRKDEHLKTICKIRYVFKYNNQTFEMDFFDFWDSVCFMEIELQDENDKIDFPPFVNLLCELTDDKKFTNHAIAKKVPDITLYLKSQHFKS